MATPTYGTYIVEDTDKEGSALQDNKVNVGYNTQPAPKVTVQKPVVAGYKPVPKKPVQTAKSEAEKLFDNVGEGTVVTHKKFGIGQITKIDRKAQYVFVAFKDGGEKKFLFPGAFTSGFLSL